jgi:hypothetical protein
MSRPTARAGQVALLALRAAAVAAALLLAVVGLGVNASGGAPWLATTIAGCLLGIACCHALAVRLAAAAERLRAGPAPRWLGWRVAGGWLGAVVVELGGALVYDVMFARWLVATIPPRSALASVAMVTRWLAVHQLGVAVVLFAIGLGWHRRPDPAVPADDGGGRP